MCLPVTSFGWSLVKWGYPGEKTELFVCGLILKIAVEEFERGIVILCHEDHLVRKLSLFHFLQLRNKLHWKCESLRHLCESVSKATLILIFSWAQTNNWSQLFESVKLTLWKWKQSLILWKWKFRSSLWEWTSENLKRHPLSWPSLMSSNKKQLWVGLRSFDSWIQRDKLRRKKSFQDHQTKVRAGFVEHWVRKTWSFLETKSTEQAISLKILFSFFFQQYLRGCSCVSYQGGQSWLLEKGK